MNLLVTLLLALGILVSAVVVTAIWSYERDKVERRKLEEKHDARGEKLRKRFR